MNAANNNLNSIAGFDISHRTPSLPSPKGGEMQLYYLTASLYLKRD